MQRTEGQTPRAFHGTNTIRQICQARGTCNRPINLADLSAVVSTEGHNAEEAGKSTAPHLASRCALIRCTDRQMGHREMQKPPCSVAFAISDSSPRGQALTTGRDKTFLNDHGSPVDCNVPSSSCVPDGSADVNTTSPSRELALAPRRASSGRENRVHVITGHAHRRVYGCNAHRVLRHQSSTLV